MKTKNIYATSDTHFSHFNIIKYENRPFKNEHEMDDFLIEKWNNKVNPQDDIYHLGDFAFTSSQRIKNIISKLNGNIYLIWGNHDKTIKQNRDIQQMFKWCRDYFSLNSLKVPIIMFHYPIQVWDRKHHGSIHLYGHIHSDKENHHPMVAELKNAFNVGTDVNNFEPVNLEELINV